MYGELVLLVVILLVFENVVVKVVDDFSLIGFVKKNLVGWEIVIGKFLFGMDM